MKCYPKHHGRQLSDPQFGLENGYSGLLRDDVTLIDHELGLFMLGCVALIEISLFLTILLHLQLQAKPGTVERHDQREVQELTKPSQTATET